MASPFYVMSFFLLVVAAFSGVWLGLFATVTPELGLGPRMLPAGKSDIGCPPCPTCRASSREVAPGGPPAEAEEARRAPEADPTGEPAGPQRILILASMRTGSSFVGELIGSSQDTFYLFEPGHALRLTLMKIEEEFGLYHPKAMYLHMLSQLFRCDFRRLEYYLRHLSKEGLEVLQHRTPRLYEECIRGQTNASKCVITQSMATRSCQASKYIVIKSIRIPTIDLLLEMIDDKAINLKVIHLVRDPRPMLMSVMYATTGRKIQNRTGPPLAPVSRRILEEYCENNILNLELGGRRLSARRRYMLLRYEDVASNPVLAAGRMFSFLGRGLVPATVMRWIAENTKEGPSNVFSTRRNSRQAYQAWRHSLPYDVAKAIEGEARCAEMMAKLGYRLLEGEGHLGNVSRSLVGQVPPIE